MIIINKKVDVYSIFIFIKYILAFLISLWYDLFENKIKEKNKNANSKKVRSKFNCPFDKIWDNEILIILIMPKFFLIIMIIFGINVSQS